MTQCFLIEPTGRIYFYATACCDAGHRHVVAERYEDMVGTMRPTGALGDYDDIDWPETCPECGLVLRVTEAENWDNALMGSTKEWVRPETGEIHNGPHEFGPGAMWNASWMSPKPDGRYLVVILPNGHEWSIDSRASNCTRNGEDHDCWCRHGDPPNLTVDKNPEPGRSTCQAGGGSIWSMQGREGDWHGFLRGGRLEQV